MKTTDNQRYLQTEQQGLPAAPSLDAALDAARMPIRVPLIDQRVVFISACAALLAVAVGFIAEFLVRLIGFVTNVSFYGRFSSSFASPAGNNLGGFVVAVPVIGGIIV